MQAGIFTIPRSASIGQMRRSDRAHFEAGRAVAAPFFVGPENRLADVAWQRAVEPSAVDNTTCPLVLCGPAGTGKTHLASAMSAAWRHSDRLHKTYCCSATKIGHLKLGALAAADANGSADAAAPASMFVVEDLQEIAKQPSAQLRLRSLIDLIKPVGGRIVITSRISPRVLPGLSAGLRSRLAGGLIVPLRAPSYETRLEMIHAFAATVDCEISLRAADVLARRESLGPCELIDAVTQLARRAVTTNQNLRSIDESMIDVTSDSPNRAPRIHKIAAATAKCFGLTVADLKGRSRRRGVANARCLLMYLAWKKGGYRLKQIGQYLDGRDHSTVLHGCQKTKQRLTEDQTTQQWIDEIVERLT